LKNTYLFPHKLYTYILLAILLMGNINSLAQAVPDTTRIKVLTDTTVLQGNLTHGGIDTAKRGTLKLTDIDTTAALVPKKGIFQPNPKKAGLYSAIVPGLGQLYNRQYWKIPVIYVGIGVAAYFIQDNLNNYNSYHNAYVGRISNPNAVDKYTNIYTTDNLKQLQNDYEKYLDLTILFTGVGYIVQVIDAVTYAYLKNFDISRDLSMRIQPVATPNGAALGLVFNIK